MSAEGLLRRAREAAGISQADLAKLAGVNGSSVSDAERNPNPSIHVLSRYGSAMGYALAVYFELPDGTIID